jgi:hypothetical protein
MKNNSNAHRGTLTLNALVGGLQLVGLGASPADSSLLEARLAPVREGTPSTQAVDASTLRAAEASHLEVYAGCKWGHAAFDPVEVTAEPLSADILALHAQLA